MASMEEVTAEVHRALSRTQKASHLDTRPELANNVYPLFLMMMDAVNSRLSETEEMVATLAAEADTIIQAEESEVIRSALELCIELCDACDSVDNDDLKAKSAKTREAIGQVAEMLEEVSLEGIEDADEGDNEDTDEEQS